MAGPPVVLRFRVRRFFCDTNNCPVWTFTEHVDGSTVKHARRMSLCCTALEHIGLALAGRAGSCLSTRLGRWVGRSTLLRLVHALPDPEVGTVAVLGVDDVAIRSTSCAATALPPTPRPICQAVPKASQASDWWHLWRDLAAVVEKRVVAHSVCWNTAPRAAGSALAARTWARFAACSIRA